MAPRGAQCVATQVCGNSRCGMPVNPRRPWGKYCSSHCRLAAWDAAHPRQRPLDFGEVPQRERVYRMLVLAGAAGVSTGDFMRAYIERFSARLHELRRMGCRIRGERIGKGQWRYCLEGGE